MSCTESSKIFFTRNNGNLRRMKIDKYKEYTNPSQIPNYFMEISVRENQIVFDKNDPDTGQHYLDQELVKDILVGIQDKEITLNLLKDIEDLVTNARVEDRMTMKQRIETGTTDFGFFELNEPDANEEED